MWSSPSRGRGFPVTRWASLGTEWDKWAAWWQRSETKQKLSVKSDLQSLYLTQSHQAECGNVVVSPPLDVWKLKHGCTEWLDQTCRKPTGDLGTAPFQKSLSSALPMLFSEQFSQGLALCAAKLYCNEIGLEIVIFILKVWWQQRGNPAHCRWRNENV